MLFLKNYFSFLILLLAFFSSTDRLNAQSNTEYDSSNCIKGWSITPVFQYGKIWKHTEKFQPTIDNHSRCFELAISKQMNGKHEWEYANHYPFLGAAIAYNIIGNDSIIGDAYSLLPYIELPIVRGKKFFATFRIGTGIAYLTKHYDEVENPINNVIASHFNNTTQSSISANWKASDHVTMLFGGSFTHYSSGAVRLPNLGINIPAWRIGIRVTPKPYSSNEFITHQLSEVPKKIFINAQLGIGFQELGAHNGPLYNVFGFELSAGKMLEHWNMISLGVYANYKESSFAFIKQQELYSDNLFLNSLGCAAFFRDDFIFGKISLPISLGYYFYAPSPLQLIFFQKIGACYNFPIGKKEFYRSISTGVYVTAGDFTADFVSLECGFRF